MMHTHHITLTRRSTEGRSWYTTDEVHRLDNTLVQWASSSNSLQTSKAEELYLAEFIDKATILCDQCNYPEEAHEWLFQDAVVIGFWFREAYFKCIEKGSYLTLNQATESQVSYM